MLHFLSRDGRGKGERLAGAPRPHEGAEDGVDPGLVALAPGFEPVGHVGIEVEGDPPLARFRIDKLGGPPERRIADDGVAGSGDM